MHNGKRQLGPGQLGRCTNCARLGPRQLDRHTNYERLGPGQLGPGTIQLLAKKEFFH